MNDIIGWIFVIASISFMIAFLVYYFRFTYKKCTVPAASPCPSTSCPASSTTTRVGLTYKPSSNVAPNNIISKVNSVFDDMKPMLCANSEAVKEQIDTSQYSGDTCSQVKEKMVAEMNNPESMFTFPEGMKKSILSLNNTIIDSVCGADNKIDMAKAAIVGSDIKGMFC